MHNRSSLSLFTGRQACLVSVLVLGLTSMPFACANDFSWTATATSPGIARQGQVAVTVYHPGKAMQQIPAGSKITRVYASRSYSGQALVHTELCWNGSQRCIELSGQHLNTQAFNGLDPSKPMYLRHTVTSWVQSPGTLYVVGNVNVWYAPPTARP